MSFLYKFNVKFVFFNLKHFHCTNTQSAVLGSGILTRFARTQQCRLGISSVRVLQITTPDVLYKTHKCIIF